MAKDAPGLRVCRMLALSILVLGLGPHVLYKDGIEVALEVGLEKKDEEREAELGLEFVYGITGDWAAGCP